MRIRKVKTAAFSIGQPAMEYRKIQGRKFVTAPANGFSLVELLVAIIIIGVLAGILTPVLSSAREAARQASCQNNLRQIGLALYAHHDSKKTFPAGGIEWRPPGNSTKRQLAWSAFLLPYLEQSAVYEDLDLSLPFDSERNRKAAATVIPVYICPTSVRGGALVEGRGPCDYGGITGERITSPNNPPKGLMIYDKKFRRSDVRDGLTNTIIVAEDSAWPDGQWINGRNIFDQAFPINAAPGFENDIRSFHSGGANVVMADASARFLSQDIEERTLAAICTRAHGEPVSAF